MPETHSANRSERSKASIFSKGMQPHSQNREMKIRVFPECAGPLCFSQIPGKPAPHLYSERSSAPWLPGRLVETSPRESPIASHLSLREKWPPRMQQFPLARFRTVQTAPLAKYFRHKPALLSHFHKFAPFAAPPRPRVRRAHAPD